MELLITHKKLVGGTNNGTQKHDGYITLIWIVSILVSVGVGTFILTVLETTMLNVWIS